MISGAVYIVFSRLRFFFACWPYQQHASLPKQHQHPKAALQKQPATGLTKGRRWLALVDDTGCDNAWVVARAQQKKKSKSRFPGYFDAPHKKKIRNPYENPLLFDQKWVPFFNY
jgi:hypothetical protein